jgi:hypothetical protein
VILLGGGDGTAQDEANGCLYGDCLLENPRALERSPGLNVHRSGLVLSARRNR